MRSLGIEWDEKAAATAVAAGHSRLVADVAKMDPIDYRDLGVVGLISSPPCQGFSQAGKGHGRKDADMLIQAVLGCASMTDVEDAIAYLAEHMHDPRSILVLEPLRWALAIGPEWMAWEQVATVRPIWDACAKVLISKGYSTEVAVLNAEQYGVPQTRRRAILVARRTAKAKLPVPTHSRYYNRTPGRLDQGVPRWVSMADALGWDLGPGNSTVRTSMGEPKRDGRNGSHQLDPAVRPSHTVTSKAGSFVLRSNYSAGGAKGATAAERGRGERELDQPAFSMTSKASSWAERRPSPTVVGPKRGVVGRRLAPGESRAVGGWDGSVDLKPGQLQGVRITVEEAGVLQSFPIDYPWQGDKTARYQQVGDAVPPLMAQRIIEAATEGIS